MSRLTSLVLAGLLITGAHLAQAQTSAVAHLAVQSGNGQVACICITATLQAFQPISVKATDVNGNPVAGATVNWSQIANPPQNGSREAPVARACPLGIDQAPLIVEAKGRCGHPAAV